MSLRDHFQQVASVYESLRTTDEAPVRRIRELLPDRPVTGVDVGCGTGRYSKLLRALLPEGSLLIASDVSAAMLAELQVANQGGAWVAPLLSTAEELPVRTQSLDLVTSFNSVHHFDLGPLFPRLRRARAAPAQRAGAQGGGPPDQGPRARRHADLPLPAREHARAAPGSGRGAPLLDVLPLRAGRAVGGHRHVPGPPARPRGPLGRRAPPDGRPPQPPLVEGLTNVTGRWRQPGWTRPLPPLLAVAAASSAPTSAPRCSIRPASSSPPPPPSIRSST